MQPHIGDRVPVRPTGAYALDPHGRRFEGAQEVVWSAHWERSRAEGAIVIVEPARCAKDCSGKHDKAGGCIVPGTEPQAEGHEAKQPATAQSEEHA